MILEKESVLIGFVRILQILLLLFISGGMNLFTLLNYIQTKA